MHKLICILLCLAVFFESFNDVEGIGPILGRLAGQAAKSLVRKLGGSGKPVQHFKHLPNRKTAQEFARNAGKGNPPVHHTAHKPGQNPHWHPTNKQGQIRKDGSHYSYPKKG